MWSATSRLEEASPQCDCCSSGITPLSRHCCSILFTRIYSTGLLPSGRQLVETGVCSRAPCPSGLLAALQQQLWPNIAPSQWYPALVYDIIRLVIGLCWVFASSGYSDGKILSKFSACFPLRFVTLDCCCTDVSFRVLFSLELRL